MTKQVHLHRAWLLRGIATAVLCITASVGAQTAAPMQTAAAAAEDGGIEDIVVTAQRRSESVQDVPIAISAFSANDLEARNISRTLDLTQYVPNLIGHNNTGLGSANAYYLRGIGTTESLATQDPPVGTYIDDIYVSRQSANNFALFNVERIEVLRGPQGTLFGRNTTGGAINVFLKKPAEEFGGFADASYGRYDRIQVRGGVDVPLSDKLRTNLSAYLIDDGGYAKNTTTGETLNGQKSYGARGAVRALLTDHVTWDVSGLYTHDKSTNLINFDCDPAAPTSCKGRFITTGLLAGSNNGANQLAPLVIANGKGNQDLGATTKVTLLSSDIAVELGDKATLNFITGYIRTAQDYLLDFFDGRAGPTLAFALDPATGRPSGYNVANNVIINPPAARLRQGGFVIANNADSKQFTQEIKLNGELFDGLVDYVTGVFYYNEKNDTDFADVLTSAVTRVPTLLADRVVSNDTRAYAGFAQFDFNLSEQFKLTAGVRYTDEQKDFAFFDNRAICAVTPVPATCLDSRNFASVDVDVNPLTPNVAIPLSQRVKIWTPRFAANFKANDDILLFASATRGFKSGSQSARATAVRSLLPFKPEKVWSYELGAKTEFFDRKLRLNLTGFHTNTKGFQGGSASINATTGALTFVTRNLADMKNTGLEIEALAIPMEGLTLSLNAGIQNNRFKIDRNAPVVDSFNVQSVAAQQAECKAALANAASPRGDARTALARAQGNCGTGIVRTDGNLATPVRSPDLTLAAGISYAAQIGGGWALTPSVNVVYTAKQEVGTANLSGFQSAAGQGNIVFDGDFLIGSFSKAHTVVNAGLALDDADKLWNVSVNCDNCFGEAYPQSTLSNYTYLSPPGTWTVRVRRKF